MPRRYYGGQQKQSEILLTIRQNVSAQTWNHNSTGCLQVPKSHICTEEAQLKNTSLCGSHKNQQSDSDDYNNNNQLVSTLSDAAQDLAGKSLFGKLGRPWLITVCRWRTNGQWKSLHSISLAELLPRKDLPEVSADMCVLFQVLFASTWTQSPKLTKVITTWTTSVSQPTMLRTLPGTFGQSSKAFAQRG